MAFPWLVVLQNVPWTEVLRNAPKVADGARKLWRTVGRREGAAVPGVPMPTTAPPDASPAQRLDVLEAKVAELHAQMLASTELIQALAEQNTQLVAQVQAVQTRLRRVTMGVVLLVVLGLVLAWRSTSG